MIIEETMSVTEDRHVDEMMEGAEDEDEFNVWKINTPLLYDFVASEGLEWPSLTVQWIPGRVEGASSTSQKFILGTHTNNDEQNHLLIAQLHIPYSSSSSSSPLIPRVEIIQRINHDGEVNKARCMPQKTNVIATMTVNSEVYIFDYQKHPSRPTDKTKCKPEVILKGHTEEGYGLSWSPLKEGYLLSGSNDSQICLWDVNIAGGSTSQKAKQSFKAHNGVVDDVSWHSKNENIFGSVGDDHCLLIWDMRALVPQHSTAAHDDNVNSLSFNCFNEWVLATCSSDKTIKLFDMRNLTSSLHTFTSHMEEVYQVAWSPFNEAVLASNGADRRVMIWDLMRIGDEQAPEDVEDGPPELIFSHGGHTNKISEFSWNPNDDRMIASVAEDNILQIWQLAENIYREEDEML